MGCWSYLGASDILQYATMSVREPTTTTIASSDRYQRLYRDGAMLSDTHSIALIRLHMFVPQTQQNTRSYCGAEEYTRNVDDCILESKSSCHNVDTTQTILDDYECSITHTTQSHDN